jgi:hypothetical protein
MAINGKKKKLEASRIKGEIAKIRKAIQNLDSKYNKSNDLFISGFHPLVCAIGNMLDVIGYEIDRELEEGSMLP